MFKDRLTLIWLLLMVATLFSWAIGHGAVSNHQFASTGVIAVAFLKIRYVGLDFMELRRAPTALRYGFEAWVVLLAALLILLLDGSIIEMGEA